MEVLNYPETTFEKLPVTIFEQAGEGAIRVARDIAELIRHKQHKGKQAVLGLATGSSPIGVYQELVRLHREEGLSFRNVVTFNLDEYYPMQPDELQSYVYFMHEQLFDHVDILPENVHIPDGTLPIEQVKAYCWDYEKQIEASGGLDLQLLGIGRTGHIGFNEPGSSSSSATRLVKLDPLTITDAAKDFIKEEYVPLRALTMGVGTIMKARKIILLAWGEGKAKILKETVEGSISDEIPASFLQQHPQVQVVVDQWAASELTRIKSPWLVGMCAWNDRLIRRAVVWLSLRTKKPILKLTDEDYKDGSLSDLLVEAGNAYTLNLKIFNTIQRTITGWPGGKPNSNDTQRPERAVPALKRSLIFSPHPDDDVISMGGTLLRLVDQGHDVHVAYQTSGNIAVFDDDARRFADFALDFAEKRNLGVGAMRQEHAEVVEFLKRKKLGEEDSPLVQEIKALIRKGEAEAACRFCGVKEANVHFMNLPFYETGQVKKKPLGEADIEETVAILQEIKPQQIFAAGDLRDPHGTHRVCLDAIFAALARLKGQEEWVNDCYLWLYRGAWQEWDVEEIEMAVPISPEELMRKRKAIFKHQSQKDSAVFPGNDKREFWQRSEDRNHATAKLYDQLGLVEYEAIEAFVRWRF
ncbi:glucosamine-6-phosphate deaminase [Hymenobacter sp. UV11]|uniref:glucosamine-6-phosphate deaminase n=1 Tax=Hymenobacter sp. UV11 TaxID=1849735 RepID=UPI00105CE104|nr:glucosamine-6-phosphate deaminase [Hymenobacter sp. UV11]TDN38708.1 glucosamine-6-phosphate deaminase [Hymenobacter sp. UV11]TFZ63469.1 glucosamine-6-phosphate deaminase [Hymenobacter sp. UV11]